MYWALTVNHKHNFNAVCVYNLANNSKLKKKMLLDLTGPDSVMVRAFASEAGGAG